MADGWNDRYQAVSLEYEKAKDAYMIAEADLARSIG
jgi:hypothetical protein